MQVENKFSLTINTRKFLWYIVEQHRKYYIHKNPFKKTQKNTYKIEMRKTAFFDTRRNIVFNPSRTLFTNQNSKKT